MNLDFAANLTVAPLKYTDFYKLPMIFMYSGLLVFSITDVNYLDISKPYLLAN
jgi:hypothetical protein